MAVVVCGEALIDLMPAPGQASTGEQSSWQAHSAGGPMNTAIAMARLGMPVQLAGRFGSDAFASQLRDHLHANGVDDSPSVEIPGGSTSLAIVSLDARGTASYNFHLHGTANFGWRTGEFPQLSSGDWFHTGSLTAALEPGRSALLEFMTQTPARLSFDVNVRPTVEPDREKYVALVEPFFDLVGQRGGVLRASDEDLQWLTGGAAPTDVLVAKTVQRYGLDLMVVTLGSQGAMAAGIGRDTVTVPGFPPAPALADTVGAGDTFTAGFLQECTAGFLQERLGSGDLMRAMRRGCAAASIVCSRVGANPPTASEVDELLAQASS